MNNTKRDFNSAAKFFLGLSMFATIMTIINSFLKISNYKMLGYGVPDTIIIEIVFDVLILVAAVFTFMKKPAGLIALSTLFIIRMFATVPWGGDTSATYMLGGKMAYLIRDFGLFAIAMCFKKNGISGWKSMLTSEGYIERHYVQKDGKNIIPKESFEEVVPENHDNHKQEGFSIIKATKSSIPEIEQEPEDRVLSVESSVSELKGKRQEESIGDDKKKAPFLTKIKDLSRGVIIGLALGLAIIVLLAVLASVVALKAYPDCINSFGEKIIYSLNLANDHLATRMLDEMMDNRYKGQFFFETPFGTVMETSSCYDDPPRFHKYYENVNAFWVADTIQERRAIDSSYYYSFRRPSSNKWAEPRKGSKAIADYYERLVNEEPNLVFIKLKLIDLSSLISDEKRTIEAISSIPTHNMKVIQKVIAHHVIEENYNRALDASEFYLGYNKNNPELIGFTSYLLFKTQDLNEAEQFANKALRKDPKQVYALEVKACIAADRTDWVEARKWSKKAIDYGSEGSEPYYVYAESLFKLGETKRAQDFYNKAYNINWESPYAEKYKECGGRPFLFLGMSFAFVKADGTIITDYNEKLYSAKSQYIQIKATVDALRVEDCELQCKLYCRGVLSTGEGSKNGYTFDSLFNFVETGICDQVIGIWGNSIPGNWPAGNYRFEIWYDGEMAGAASFSLY